MHPLVTAACSFTFFFLSILLFPQFLGYRALFLVVCFLVLQYQSQLQSADPYGLFHLSLNRLPGEPDGSAPETEWLNMGFWKDTSLFPEACEALAKKTITAARLKPGARVLDVGHGTGESIRLMLLNSSVPRPAFVCGITSLPVHHTRSQQRIAQLNQPTFKTEVILHLGDAVFNDNDSGHPLDPVSSSRYDAILAIDCVYHFHTREKFLKQSFNKLAPSGRIALSDICLDPNRINNIALKAVLSLVRLIPRHNMFSVEECENQLKGIGFVDVEVEDITEDVFPGFIAFLRTRGFAWTCFSLILRAYISAGARFVIAAGSRGELL